MQKLNRTMYYLLSLTWGLPMTLIGLIMSAFLIMLGYKPKRFGWTFYFEVGKGWGGIDLGLTFICNKHNNSATKAHEFGHSIQNCFFGPFMLIVVSVPSAIRYWYREYQYRKGIRNLPDYDAIWFEGQATQLGAWYRDAYFYNS